MCVHMHVSCNLLCLLRGQKEHSSHSTLSTEILILNAMLQERNHVLWRKMYDDDWNHGIQHECWALYRPERKGVLRGTIRQSAPGMHTCLVVSQWQRLEQDEWQNVWPNVGLELSVHNRSPEVHSDTNNCTNDYEAEFLGEPHSSSRCR